MPGIKELRIIGTRDSELNQVQQNMQLWAQPFTSCSILNGILLQGIELLAGQDNVVEHKLNRTIVGWFVSRPKANATVWEVVGALPAKNLTLQTSADTTVDLWIF